MNDISYLYDKIKNWLENFPTPNEVTSIQINSDSFEQIANEFVERLKNNYPFHHPLYIGQMLKPPAPEAMMAYLATMLINPNNHALDGGPATAQMEKEVIAEFAQMFGFPKYLGHLTTSGTIANFEALWISREINPDGMVAFSEDAHYTHERVCSWLRIPFAKINALPNGKMDLNHLEHTLKNNNIKTVVATLATTSLGANDPLDDLLKLKEKYGFRLHIDAAYGGYFKLISNQYPSLEVYNLIKYADSVTFDPHKQGLQPYGCGCVLFADPSVGKFYKHNSSYTYFTSNELHLGEISVECSRAGAAAAALWFTNKIYPLKENEGLGIILSKTIELTKLLVQELEKSDNFRPYILPETNILTYFPLEHKTSLISKKSEQILQKGIETNKLWVATLKVPSEKFNFNHPNVVIDSNDVTILRSCLIKPFDESWISLIINNLQSLYGSK